LSEGLPSGPKKAGAFFPFGLNFGGNPACENRRAPQRMAVALLRLNHQLIEVAQSLDGIDFAVDNGYHGRM